MNVHLQTVDSVLRHIDRELWIITAAHSAQRSGLLATWVSTASIDRERPVLLAGLGPNHFTAELVLANQAFAAHLLRPDQSELAWNFARDSGRSRDKLAGLAIELGVTGSPLITDCLARFDCRVFARYDAGDRLFVWADVVAAQQAVELESVVQPLREHGFFSRLTAEQRQVLAADRQADVAQNRLLHESWRQQWS